MILPEKSLCFLNKKNIRTFCEIGVYEYSYCRLINEINSNKKVILVEALPRCCEDIAKNIKFKENTILYPVAISDISGYTKIYDEGASAFIDELRYNTPSYSNKYYDIPSRPIRNDHIFDVKTITFNEIDNGEIDVLFIDIEGAEYFVLKHLISRPILISIETSYENYTNPFLSQINEWMDKNGYIEYEKNGADTIFVKK